MTEEFESGVEIVVEDAAPEIQEEATPEPVQSPVESDQDRNWREMRQAMTQMASQNAELRQQLESIARPSDSAPQEVDLPDDEWVTGKDAKALTAHLVKEQVAQQLKEHLANQDESTAESRLKSKFSDYDKIVSAEAVNKLKEEDPDFVETIRNSKSSTYQKGAAVYNYLKKSYPANAQMEENRQRIEANSKKPKPLDAVGRSSPLAQIDANGGSLSPDLKKSLYLDMLKASRG